MQDLFLCGLTIYVPHGATKLSPGKTLRMSTMIFYCGAHSHQKSANCFKSMDQDESIINCFDQSVYAYVKIRPLPKLGKYQAQGWAQAQI